VQAIADEDQRCLRRCRPRATARRDQQRVTDLERRDRCASDQFGAALVLIDQLLLEGDGLEIAIHPRRLQPLLLQAADDIGRRAVIAGRAGETAFHPIGRQRADIGPPLRRRIIGGQSGTR
jgi:hypothetical protein